MSGPAATFLTRRPPPEAAPVAPSSTRGLKLQRKCACGGAASKDGDCPECERKKRLQTKLAVGSNDDPLEREADRIADQVAGASGTPAAAGVTPPHIQRFAGHAGGADEGAAPETVNQVIAGSGTPLEAVVRRDMERRLGHDFSRVRVHAGPAAEQSARDVNAHAYTVDHHIVFGAGRFAPATHDGRRLIAHELTHVVQQGGAAAKQPGGGGVPVQMAAGHRLMRSVTLDSTVNICRRVLTSRTFKVTQGGLRVVLLLKPLDKNVPDCQDHQFSVTLNRSVDWGFDDEVASCEGRTGGTRSFSFSNLSAGSYYLTIARNFDNPYCCLDGDILAFDEAVPSNSASCKEHKSLSTLDIVHGALDIAGFIPVLGAIPDGINAGIYAVEGDWVNAGISVVAMVPLWGDGVKLASIGGKATIKFSEKAAVRLGEEGIAKVLKEGRAAAKAEKVAVEVTEDASKATARLEKEAAEKAAKEAAAKEGQTATKAAEKEAEKTAEKKAEQEAEQEAEKKAEKGAETEKEKKKGGGKYTCYGWSAVLQIPSALPEHRCPLDGQYFRGPSVSASNEAAACLAAKHAFNAVMPRGCRPKHLDCRCSKR
jgi:hypothetical protein